MIHPGMFPIGFAEKCKIDWTSSRKQMALQFLRKRTSNPLLPPFLVGKIEIAITLNVINFIEPP